MQCYCPIKLTDEKGSRVVPCGRCYACLSRRRDDWIVRLENELRVSENAWFITLTYDDRYLTYGNDEKATLMKSDLQKFIKRLRRKNPDKNIRYYAVGEYGSQNQRPHYHLILFNLHSDEMKVHSLVEEKWSIKKRPIGQIHVGSVTPKSISYVCKYVIQKRGQYDGREPPFSLMSKRPPLGINYIKRYENYHRADRNRMYAPLEGGRKTALPRIYKEKIYSEEDRRFHRYKSEKRAEKEYKKRKEEYEKLKKGRTWYKDFDMLRCEAIHTFENEVEQSMKKREL